MWTNQNKHRLEARNASASASHRLSWLDTWLAIREALRSHPDAAEALASLLDRLIAEVDLHGDPGRSLP